MKKLKMKKILCPTNFSETSSNGISYAAKLAKKIGAELILFNVRSMTDVSPEELLLGERVNFQSAKDQLEKVCDEVTKVFKVSCYADVETSILSRTKIISGKAEKFDLVVMGTNGADSFGQYFLGSDTYNIIKNLNVPAIAVPSGCVYSDIVNIVYAYDHWRSNSLPLVQLIGWTKILGSKLCVLQVMEESVSLRADAELAGLQQATLNLYKGDVDMRFETIHAPSVSEGINNYMQNSKADLLALCSEHHGFIGSLFHKSVLKAISGKPRFPVFVFHA
jgi:nucleotide-binding universal stress UspA family protein